MNPKSENLADETPELQASQRRPRPRATSRPLWGVILILAGAIWFAKEIGWLTWDIPVMPTILILIGIAVLARPNGR